MSDRRPRVEVGCGGARHLLELWGGDIIVLDHDERAEDVLGALGAAEPHCVRVARLWRDPPWHDAVACLLLDDDDALAAAAGKGAAANGLAARLRTSSSPVALRGVDRLRTSSLLLGLPSELRKACGRRALDAREAQWRSGEPVEPTEIGLLERQLDPVIARRLGADGRHLPPGGRPVRVHIVGPERPRSLVPGRKAWDATIPIDTLADLLFCCASTSVWFGVG